eukprot:scaffold168914_cov32-Tisochrysis_lutea.AAC.4
MLPLLLSQSLHALVSVKSSRPHPTLQAGEIPRSGDVLYVDQLRFFIAEADERRILQIFANRMDGRAESDLQLTGAIQQNDESTHEVSPSASSSTK